MTHSERERVRVREFDDVCTRGYHVLFFMCFSYLLPNDNRDNYTCFSATYSHSTRIIFAPLVRPFFHSLTAPDSLIRHSLYYCLRARFFVSVLERHFVFFFAGF